VEQLWIAGGRTSKGPNLALDLNVDSINNPSQHPPNKANHPNQSIQVHNPKLMQNPRTSRPHPPMPRLSHVTVTCYSATTIPTIDPTS
jgi:hypothetical protein